MSTRLAVHGCLEFVLCLIAWLISECILTSQTSLECSEFYLVKPAGSDFALVIEQVMFSVNSVEVFYLCSVARYFVVKPLEETKDSFKLHGPIF